MAAEIMASFVLANNFMFCKHGYEYCSHCGCDHAYVNDNFLTMNLPALDARLSEYGNTAGLLVCPDKLTIAAWSIFML